MPMQFLRVSTKYFRDPRFWAISFCLVVLLVALSLAYAAGSFAKWAELAGL